MIGWGRNTFGSQGSAVRYQLLVFRCRHRFRSSVLCHPSSMQSSIQASTLSSVQSSILPNQSSPRAGVIAGGFAEADAAGIVVGPFDGNLDELRSCTDKPDEGFGAERETARVGRHL